MAWYIILLYVIINIVQTRLIFARRFSIKGGIIIGIMEIIEIPLIIYLILKEGMAGFLAVVFVETIQWIIVAYFAVKD